MTLKTINIKIIRIDGGTQSRVEINNGLVAEYAEAIKAKEKFPPMAVFHDGVDYWLADGFHRWHALNQAGKTSAEVEIYTGTLRDAKLHSAGANGAHGQRRTNADKRKAALMLLEDAEWVKWSDNRIATELGLSHTFVASVRLSLATDASEKSTERVYKTKSGTESTMETVGIGKKKKPKSEAKEPAKPEKKPDPKAQEKDDAFDGFDPVAELESTQKELEAAQRVNDSLAKDDTKAELKKQIEMRQGIEARLNLEMNKVNQLQRELDSYGKWYADLRKISGLEKRSDITRLVREASKVAA